MTASNLQASFDATMVWEGGATVSNDPRDPGNWTGNRVGVGKLVGTRWGVSAGSHPTLDILNLTKDQAVAIFKSGYWDACGCDNMPGGLDHCVSDDAYNAGPGNARRLIGATEGSDTVSRIKSFSALRLSFLRGLRIWATFRRGLSRRVGGVEAESIAMAMTAGGLGQVSIEDTITSHASDVKNRARAQVKKATATSISAAGAGAIHTSAPQAYQAPAWVLGVILAIVVLSVIAFAVSAAMQSGRAAGLLASIKGTMK